MGAKKIKNVENEKNNKELISSKLVKITTPISLTEIAVRAAYQVVVTDKNLNPKSMGSGCLLCYREKLFFLTVAHVTDKLDVSVTIETNKDPVQGKTPNYCVGQMNYRDLYKVKDIEGLKSGKELSLENLEKLERLDFSFAELKEVPEILQKPIDLEEHGFVPQCGKIVIPGEALDTRPTKEEPLLFYGTITPKLEKGILSRLPKLTVDAEYIRDEGRFYRIKLKSVIENESEYQGTSGAPVFDTQSNFIGLISHGFEGTPFIRVFKNSEIKEILDSHINQNI